MKRIVLLISVIILNSMIFGCTKQEDKVKSSSNDITKEQRDVYLKNKEELINSEEIVETVIEEERKVIVIDPGHSSTGNRDKEPIAPNSNTMKAKDVLGATGAFSNIPEHITTVVISNILEEKLTDMGFNVIMTKNKVEKSLSNVDRAKIGNEAQADLVIRIHADSAESQSANGASVLIPPKNEHTIDISDISREYGEKIINTYTNELNLKNRGIIYRDDMTGFNWSEVPVIILEMGFLSNKDDDIFLSDEKNHEKIANSIANGINNALKK